MNEHICNLIQEEIAWGRTLSEEHQRHVLSCEFCKKVALQFEKLDADLGPLFNTSVPDNFADRVMEKIHADSAHLEPSDWFGGLAMKVSGWLELRPVQIGAAYIGFLFTIGNLARFIFSLLAASTA